jgi:hypothetical protein
MELSKLCEDLISDSNGGARIRTAEAFGSVANQARTDSVPEAFGHVN